MESNIKRRETQKLVEIDGREFIINMFDPMLGNYILLQVVNFILPFGISSELDEFLGSAGEDRKPMSKNEFMDLQKDILMSINERLIQDNPPVIRPNGTYGIEDVSMKLIIRLIIESLTFNFSDFFEDGQLNELSGQLSISPHAHS